ncbi:unnamed protein product [Dibothriocephalus latus]|uniref:U-box domain-containing protein n=1 Tax=Dibothriocephalus latus TaxID=60516 RepID=A0A3P7MPJ9_DIBLA|nr:unnamed protein product [Dibothriocephalus latus]
MAIVSTCNRIQNVSATHSPATAPKYQTLLDSLERVCAMKVNSHEGTSYILLVRDATDPFNRQPLEMAMVEPATELKAQIDAWLKSRREQRQKATQ